MAVKNEDFNEMVTIPWEEYKELLTIKGRYEELKERTDKPNYSWGIDWGKKDSESVPISGLNNPISRYSEQIPVEC